MLYTREQLQNELIKAHEAKNHANKEYKRVRDIKDNNLPNFKGSRFSDDNAEWREEMRKWREEYEAPAIDAQKDLEYSTLYEASICELLKRSIHEEIDALFYSEEYLNKFNDTPIRYKRVKSYISDRFPGWYLCIGNDGYITAYFEPVPDNYDLKWRFEYLRVPGKYSSIWDDVSVSRDSLDAGAGQYFREDGPTFAEIRRACRKAPHLKEKREAILEKANNEAHDIAQNNCHGITAIYNAICNKR